MVIGLKKTVEINLHLFGKPEWEFGEEINPQIIKAKGEELKERLYQIATNFEKLCKNGWEPSMTLYDVIFYKKTTKAAAEKELKKLEIDEEVQELDDEQD